MAKRFTDSSKFRDPWYRKLSPKLKCLWEYFLSECDIAGIIDIDLDAIEFHIGEEITIEEIKSFGDRLFFLETNKVFIPKFVSFQQNTLNPENRAHKGIISSLEKYNIPLDLNIDNYLSPLEGALMPLGRGQGISKGIGIGIGISKEEKITENNIKKKNLKGSRLPDDWDCSVELGTWAMNEYGMSRDDVAQEIYAFQDYWKAKTGANAIKLDWDATFRNWIRNNAKWSKK